MPENLGQKFLENVESYPAKTAIQWKRQHAWINISYESLKNNVKSLALFLLTKDIKRGDRVGIILENRPEWPVIFFSIASIGAISVPINPEARPREVENILRDSECKLVFASANSFLLKEEISLKYPFMKDIISVSGSELCLFSAPKEAHIPEAPGPAGNDIACILYTSGTTAQPKGVMLSHRNLFSNCNSLEEVGIITPYDRIISVLPLYHADPLTITMLLPRLDGSTGLYPESMRGEDVLKAMREARATVFIAVPQIFYSFHQKITEALKKIPFPFSLLLKAITESLYKLRKKRNINLARYFFWFLHMKFGRSLRFFGSGGAKLNEEVEEAFFKFGFTILEGYGLTETSPVLAMSPPNKPKIGSVGLPIPRVELNIINKDEKGRGEIIARGANIMEGYYKRNDLTGDVIKDGWFHTGDLGYMDEDGYLFLTGRAKDVIVLSSGLNIYPDEIEEAYLRDVPAKEMCVFEVPAKKGMKESQVLWAVIVPDIGFFKKYGEVNLRHVIKERLDNVSKTLPASKRLMGFSITLEPFPRTLLGKIKRFEVKKIYTPKIVKEKYKPEVKELSEEDRRLAESPCGRGVIDYLKKETKTTSRINPCDLLELDLGIDSLGRIELASGLEKAFNIKIEDEIIGSAFTVRDLILGIQPILALAEVKGTRPLLEEQKGVRPLLPDYWKKTLEVQPKKENLKKIDLKPGFVSWLSCFLFIAIWWVIFKLFYKLKVEGRENFPKEGPYILYVNHASYFDGLVVAASLPHFPRLDLFFIGFRPYFSVPIIRNLVKIGRIIPLDFSSHLLEALRSSYYVLKHGKNLCVFPEGLRTLDGEVKEFKTGFGILAKESDAKLIPIFLKGTFEAWPRTSKFPKHHPITVRFGKPQTMEEAEKKGYEAGAKDSYEAICLSARQSLIEL